MIQKSMILAHRKKRKAQEETMQVTGRSMRTCLNAYSQPASSLALPTLVTNPTRLWLDPFPTDTRCLLAVWPAPHYLISRDT
jgi:hypothetical protein